MKNFKFDPNINRDITAAMAGNTIDSENKYPDVAVIFKLPKKDEGFYYSGSISVSLLEKLFTEPTREVNIIDKSYLLNCPDPTLSDGLRNLQDLTEIDCNTVRTHPQYCVNGFNICNRTVTGEEIFPSNGKIVKVYVDIRYTDVPLLLYTGICRKPETTYRDSVSGNYYQELREDLVYFISDSNTIQIYYHEKSILPDNVYSEANDTIDESHSWLYKLNTYRLSLEDSDSDYVSNPATVYVDSIRDFMYERDSFNVLDFTELISDLVRETGSHQETTHLFS